MSSTRLDRMRAIGDEMRQLADKKAFTESDEARIQALSAEFDSLERAADRARSQALDSDPLGEPASTRRSAKHSRPWALNSDEYGWRTASPTELRSRAKSAIENLDGASDGDRAEMTRKLETFDDDQGSLSRVALVASDPAYLRAFSEMLKTGGQAALLTEEEVQAVRRMKVEARAMGLTDNAGGFLIPFQLDPAVVIISDGSFNPVRRVARQVVATGDTWNPVSSGAPSWSWDAEAAEVSDDATTFAQPSISIHKAAGFIPISLEGYEDEANVAEEVRRLLAFGRDTLEATAFATGSGTGQPFGIITALNGAAPPVVAAATNNSFGSVDVYALDEALAARYRMSPQSAWFAHRAILNLIDQMETSNGAKLFDGVVGNPGMLLGRPTYEMEGMDGVIATGDDYVLVTGDFQHYVIADRSSAVEFIPHLFSTGAGRPTGQRGIYAYFRTGADSINDGAFKLLRV